MSECPCPNCPSPSDCDGADEIARLREREAHLPRDLVSGHWKDRAEAAEAEMARLREREAQLEERLEQVIKDNANAWTEGWTAPQARLVAAEARVAELENADWTAQELRINGLVARVARLEEALRYYADDELHGEVARRALSHEEEA